MNLPPHTINKWNTGNYRSYRNYIAQLSEYFCVSIQYLLGDTDEKTPTTGNGDGLTEAEMAILALFRQLNPDMKRVLKAQLSALVQSQNVPGDRVKTE